MRGKLILFDIDGTLLDTGGAGMAALRRAAVELHGHEGPDLHLAGATDSGLVREVLEHFELEASEASIHAFYDVYLAFLEEHLRSGDFQGRVFSGVRELLGGLREAGATLGLLTGNVARGAEIKIAHFGLSGYFDFGAFGDDHHDRNELGPIALARAETAAGRPFRGSETVVIGDTPKDIDCGRAIGAVTLGVATGTYTSEELREHGADLVFSEFGEASEVVAVLRAAFRRNGG